MPTFFGGPGQFGVVCGAIGGLLTGDVGEGCGLDVEVVGTYCMA